MTKYNKPIIKQQQQNQPTFGAIKFRNKILKVVIKKAICCFECLWILARARTYSLSLTPYNIKHLRLLLSFFLNI